MLGVGKALHRLRDDVTYPGAPGCPVVSADALDEEWLPVVAAEGWSVLMRDKRIRRRPGEKDAFVTHGAIAFVFTGAGNLSKWDQMRLLVRFWDRIHELIEDPEPGPRMYRVTQGGVTAIEL
jgi:hypothetical protein